ncbi:MAG: hypothetical protein ACJAZ0_002646 [Halioglobus sp.]
MAAVLPDWRWTRPIAGHVFGDFDALSWDLGDPDGEVITNPLEIKLSKREPNELPISAATLRALVNTPDESLTFTAVPPGSGERIGVDRDSNGDGIVNSLDLGLFKQMFFLLSGP